MSRLLLDTSVLVSAERGQLGQRGRGKATGPLAEVLTEDADVAIATLTLAELSVGVELASERHRESRSAFIADVRRTLPALPYDDRVADAHATLLADVRRAGRPRGAHDLIIAATAAAWHRTVVTSDARAFADLPGVDVREVRLRD